MSFCNILIPPNYTTIPVDTRETAWKVVFLPTASTNQGRIITIKDQYGTARISSFTVSTMGLDTIDQTNYFMRFTSTLQSVTFFSDGLTNWQSLSYLYQNPAYQTPFSPSTFSTLAVWLDAKDPWNQGSLSTVVQTHLPIWYDKSGGKRNMRASTISGTTTNRMSTFIYYPSTTSTATFVVRYYGNNVVHNLSSLYFSTGDVGTTAFLVFSGNGTLFRNGSPSFFGRGIGTDTTLSYNQFYGNTNAYAYNNGNSGQNFTTSTWVWSPSTAKSFFRYNGSNIGTAPYWQLSTNQLATSLYIGNYTGNIGEFIYYNSPLPSSQIFIVEGYLAWKWGIQTYLNSTHPYRFVSPSIYDVNYTFNTT